MSVRLCVSVLVSVCMHVHACFCVYASVGECVCMFVWVQDNVGLRLTGLLQESGAPRPVAGEDVLYCLLVLLLVLWLLRDRVVQEPPDER